MHWGDSFIAFCICVALGTFMAAISATLCFRLGACLKASDVVSYVSNWDRGSKPYRTLEGCTGGRAKPGRFGSLAFCLSIESL